MKQVPFYANHPDGMHCMLAAYRSVFDFFLRQKLSWAQLEAITGYTPGRPAWTVKSLVYMDEHGFDIRMVEPFNYKRYLEEENTYLRTLYTSEKLQWFYDHTNIRDIKPLIPPFLKHITYECRRATLHDIDDMLSEGRLVFITLDSCALNDKPGFSEHALLIIGKDNDTYITHDSGGKTIQPQPNRRIPRDKLWAAMGGEGNTAEVTGFKLKASSQHRKRLDVYVTEQLPDISRAFAAKLCEQGKVLVNDKPAKPGHRLQASDKIQINYVPSKQRTPDIQLPVLYEDDDCIVINKPSGVLTHSQGSLHPEATVATFLRGKLKDIGGERGGIVHRLDRATSGIIIGAKHQAALSFLQKQFSARKVKKTYTAVVQGAPTPAEAIIDMPIGRNPKAPATFRVDPNGKPAVTQYKVLQTNDIYSLVELRPETGRTHQLRVHLQKVGHPIVGDPLYGHGKHGDRLFLHALSLEIALPNGKHKTFRAPLPAEFAEKLRASHE